MDADIRTGWTWWEILRNIPADNLAAYQQSACSTTRVPTKACTSGVAYTLGRLHVPAVAGQDRSRRWICGGRCVGRRAGFLIHGPLCHYWLMWTEAELVVRRRVVDHAGEVFADQTAWSLFLNSAYTDVHHVAARDVAARVKDEIQATWWNAISAGWKFWPFVHMLTFSPSHPAGLQAAVGGLRGGDLGHHPLARR